MIKLIRKFSESKSPDFNKNKTVSNIMKGAAALIGLQLSMHSCPPSEEVRSELQNLATPSEPVIRDYNLNKTIPIKSNTELNNLPKTQTKSLETILQEQGASQKQIKLIKGFILKLNSLKADDLPHKYHSINDRILTYNEKAGLEVEINGLKGKLSRSETIVRLGKNNNHSWLTSNVILFKANTSDHYITIKSFHLKKPVPSDNYNQHQDRFISNPDSQAYDYEDTIKIIIDNKEFRLLEDYEPVKKIHPLIKSKIKKPKEQIA